MNRVNAISINQSTINRINGIIFLSLLFWRITVAGLVQWVWNGEIPYPWEVSFLLVVYTAISFAIWLNKGDLQSLNIDKSFVYIFLLIGGIYSLVLPHSLGIFLGLITLINLFILYTHSLHFDNINLVGFRNSALILTLVLPDFIVAFWFRREIAWVDSSSLISAMFKANLPLVAFEEVIYRGMLWRFLKNYDFGNGLIILLQAAVFWFSHFYYFTQPVLFWFILPSISLLLGVVVMRTKSLGASTCGHYLHNLIALFIR